MQVERYTKIASNNVSESTVNSRVSGLNSFMRHAGNVEPNKENVEAWMEHLIEEFNEGNVSSGTIKQYFKSVKYYMETLHGGADEIEHVRKWIPDGETDHGDYLTEEEWERLISYTMSRRNETFYILMYQYARRPGEVLLLNMEDINFEKGTITFPILKKQEPFRATFELEENSKKAIQEYLDYRSNVMVEAEQDWEEEEVSPLFSSTQGRIKYDTMWREMKKDVARAGIDKNISPGSLRHTRATHLDWSGADPGSIARHQLLHGPNTNVIDAYIHDRDEEQVRKPMSTEEDD